MWWLFMRASVSTMEMLFLCDWKVTGSSHENNLLQCKGKVAYDRHFPLPPTLAKRAALLAWSRPFTWWLFITYCVFFIYLIQRYKYIEQQGMYFYWYILFWVKWNWLEVKLPKEEGAISTSCLWVNALNHCNSQLLLS